ncbi:hypothetical protein [Thiocapsa bogorovii]|uniref:hypothetical protein n=1 Tax=Thiocapsa bogorovii TaxID=521689 RepID=UPI001E43F88C|nr:hypothetical protein [Thiocapsa bogorovii]UHD16087.1 hypothetical protein LT988_23030 [Thiocapsa bogorovii]
MSSDQSVRWTLVKQSEQVASALMYRAVGLGPAPAPLIHHESDVEFTRKRKGQQITRLAVVAVLQDHAADFVSRSNP